MAEPLAKTYKDHLPAFLFWFFALICLVPWVYIQHQTSVNSDVAWLSICAARILDGGSLLQDCYDSNPPLSILIYIPYIWLSNALDVPTYDTLFWVTTLWAGLGVLTTITLLQSFPVFNAIEKRIIALTYLCAVTIIPTIYLSERDHFLAIMILPFILLQLALTYGYKTARMTTVFVLVLGGITLLLKPHYGLIPAFLFLHRMVVQKRLWVMKDIDFLTLLFLTGVYVGVVLLYFQGFAHIILPDILQTYLHYNAPQRTYATAMPYIVLTVCCLGGVFLLKDHSRSVLQALGICAGLALVIYIIQMKGFTYHRLPLYAVLFPLSSVLLFKLVQKPFKSSAPYIFMLVIFAASYALSPLRPHYPTHKEYQDNVITRYINTHCAHPCSFYITYENMDIVSQLAFYSHNQYATRFPSFWFLANINALPAENKQAATLRYARYVAEDINRFSPSLILVLSSSPALDQVKQDDTLMTFFPSSPEFESAISRYTKTDRLTMDRAAFYKDTPYDFPYMLTWDVYTKVSDE